MDPIYEPYWTNYLKQFDLPNSYFQNIPLDTNKFCVIVEPREHPLLVLVLKNFMYLLQKKGWGLIIFHSKKNEKMLKSSLENWKTIVYCLLEVDNLTIDLYNTLYKSSEFWNTLKAIGAKHILTFQTDTILLKNNVDDFLEYDYVGAPWKEKYYDFLEIGNNGLAIMNVDKMLYIVENCGKVLSINNEIYVDLSNNDIFFSFWSKALGFHLPTVDIAKQFSVETIFYENPTGLHKPHLDKDQLILLLKTN